MKKLIFLCIALAVVIFSVIVLNISPMIHDIKFDYHESCKQYSDKYKYDKEKKAIDLVGVANEDKKTEYLDLLKEGENKCKKNKAMIGLEYASLNINIVFGFTSVILGLLYYLGVGNNLGKIIGLIGLIAGVIGFVLTFIYVIYSGIIFTNDVVGKKFDYGSQYEDAKPKIDSDGAYLEWNADKKIYRCIFYDKENKDSLYQKYSDYGNKYLSYNTDIAFASDKKKFEYQVFDLATLKGGCIFKFLIDGSSYPGVDINTFWDTCKLIDEENTDITYGRGKFNYYDDEGNKKGDCEKLYYIDNSNKSNENKDKYDKWVASIVLSCFIFVFDLGLAVFGFLLFKDSNGSTPGL